MARAIAAVENDMGETWCETGGALITKSGRTARPATDMQRT